MDTLERLDKINKLNLTEEQKIELREMRDAHNLFFLRAKIDEILTPPLEYWTTEDKRLFLKNNWTNISIHKDITEGLSLPSQEIEPESPEDLNDKEALFIFQKYREKIPEFFAWQEKLDRKLKYDNWQIRDNYNIKADPEAPYAENEEYIYARASKNYGVIYELNGVIRSFFKLNPKREEKIIDGEKKFGKISEEELQHFLNNLKRNSQNGDIESLSDYFYLREKLPESMRQKFEKNLNISLPVELNKNFESVAQFKKVLRVSGFMAKLRGEKDLTKKLEVLRALMETLLLERKENSENNYFGYSSEDISLLDFFASFVKKT